MPAPYFIGGTRYNTAQAVFDAYCLEPVADFLADGYDSVEINVQNYIDDMAETWPDLTPHDLGQMELAFMEHIHADTIERGNAHGPEV